MMEEIFEKKPVKIIEIPLMTAGLCGYGDSGNVYIKDSTMYDIMPKLLGISLIITHQGKEAVGEVVEVFQNPNDTDQWIGKISVRSEEAKRLLEAGWGVSTAYRIIKDTGVSGKWNNIDYTTEVQDVEWLHVAVVENPRYTIAKDGVFINSKDNIVYSKILKKKERKLMFNLFKTKKEKINLNEDEKIYVKLDEEDIELKDLIEMVKEKEEEKKTYAEDDMVIEINGESLTVKELVEKYNACKKNACGKKNEEEKEEVEIKEEKKENEEDKEEKVEIKEEKKENEEEKEEVKIEEEKKENEEDKDEDKKDNEEEKEEIKEEKKEIKNSIDLRTAYINRGSDVAIRHDYLTTKERMELAHKKYGSNK